MSIVALKMKTPRACKCADKVDRLLDKQGETLITSFHDGRVVVATQNVATGSRHGKLTAHLVCNYCPFCGKKYRERKDTKRRAARPDPKGETRKGRANDAR